MVTRRTPEAGEEDRTEEAEEDGGEPDEGAWEDSGAGGEQAASSSVRVANSGSRITGLLSLMSIEERAKRRREEDRIDFGYR